MLVDVYIPKQIDLDDVSRRDATYAAGSAAGLPLSPLLPLLLALLVPTLVLLAGVRKQDEHPTPFRSASWTSSICNHFSPYSGES